jgi:hemerythrin-like domain-containing protein
MPILIGAKPESNFTDPIGLLGDCHRRIERFLEVLVRVAERGGALDDERRTALDTALRYFREAAPKHTADEEESLFPRLRRIESPGLQAVLARVESLEEDHVLADRIHAEVDDLGQSWLREGSLPAQQVTRLQTILAELRELYRQHIQAEDHEVFPAAAAVLSASDRQTIGKEMASRRGVSGSR